MFSGSCIDVLNVLTEKFRFNVPIEMFRSWKPTPLATELIGDFRSIIDAAQ